MIKLRISLFGHDLLQLVYPDILGCAPPPFGKNRRPFQNAVDRSGKAEPLTLGFLSRSTC
ncbi:hypothetical protein BJV82DRAFT_612995 [Fennellomyces sp. T-0311]|nr:hypothetical protein BJV82DRAFT_612995 [Fennellomyces sp. T-0311]